MSQIIGLGSNPMVERGEESEGSLEGTVEAITRDWACQRKVLFPEAGADSNQGTTIRAETLLGKREVETGSTQRVNKWRNSSVLPATKPLTWEVESLV